MAITFIPELYSALMLDALERNLVYAGPGVVNRDYEGEIANMGDTVRVRTVGDPTIATYEKNVTNIVPETLTDVQRSLTITESKYFAFELDDIDAAQSPGGELDSALNRGAFGLRNVADTFVAGKYTEVAAANQVGTLQITTGAQAYSMLLDLKVALDEADVPNEGRYVVVPAFVHALLLDEDKFVRVDASGTSEGLRNGMVGRAVGFDIMMSNNAPLVTGDDYACLAGIPGAISYAEQINKVETYRPEDSFSDAVKGLHLYGAKVMRPTALASAIASRT